MMPCIGTAIGLAATDSIHRSELKRKAYLKADRERKAFQIMDELEKHGVAAEYHGGKDIYICADCTPLSFNLDGNEEEIVRYSLFMRSALLEAKVKSKLEESIKNNFDSFSAKTIKLNREG